MHSPVANTEVTSTFRQPFDYIDKACLAASSRRHGVSNAPTWELVIDGTLAPETCREALDLLVRRYPWCCARVESLDGGPFERSRRFAYVLPRHLDGAELFEDHDLAPDDESGFRVLAQRLRDRFIDLTSEPPLRCVLVRRGADRCHLLLQQHHGLADGRAFMELIADFARAIEAVRGRANLPADDLRPRPRRPELEAFGLTPWGLRWQTLRGLWIYAGLGLYRLTHPLDPLVHNRSLDYSGSNKTLHVTYSAGEVSRWRALRRAHRLGLNAVLTAVLFRAMGRWSAEQGVPPGRTNASLIAETRPREGGFDSFANHLAAFLVELRLDRPGDALSLMHRIQGQVRRQARRREHLARALVERRVVMALRLEALRRAIFEHQGVSINLNFSNLIPLPFPDLSGAGWRLRDVRITTPVAPRTAVVLTAISRSGAVTFNVNYKDSVVSDESAQRLVAIFREDLSAAWAALAAKTPSAGPAP